MGAAGTFKSSSRGIQVILYHTLNVVTGRKVMRAFRFIPNLSSLHVETEGRHGRRVILK